MSSVLNSIPIASSYLPACVRFKLSHGLVSFAIFLPNRRELGDAAAHIAARDFLAEYERQAGPLGPFVRPLLAANSGVEFMMRRTAEMVSGLVRQGEGDPLDADLPVPAEATVKPDRAPTLAL